jgi:hypothetical protein
MLSPCSKLRLCDSLIILFSSQSRISRWVLQASMMKRESGDFFEDARYCFLFTLKIIFISHSTARSCSKKLSADALRKSQVIEPFVISSTVPGLPYKTIGADITRFVIVMCSPGKVITVPGPASLSSSSNILSNPCSPGRTCSSEGSWRRKTSSRMICSDLRYWR